MNKDKKLSGRFFGELVMGYRLTRTVTTAERLGIFSALGSGALSARHLAERLELSNDLTGRVLDVLAAANLIEKHGADYALTDFARATLHPSGGRYVGNNLQLQHRLWECWGALEDTVKNGKPVRPLEELLHDEGAGFTDDYIRGMIPVARGPAAEIAKIVDGHSVAHALDVGGGPGVYAAALLDRFPEARVTLMDLAPTLAIASELHQDRPGLELREGNYLTDDYGEGFDLVVMSHVTHDESPQSVLAMLRRARRAMTTDGRLVIHDFVHGDNNALWSSLFSLNLALYTDGGRVYSVQDYTNFLVEAGFSEPEVHDVASGDAPPTVALVARARE
ncbi:MAG: methyltransferase [Myxococcota bacterium]